MRTWAGNEGEAWEERICGTNLDLQAILLRPRRAVGRGEHLHSLAIPDDAAEDAAEGQEHLLRRVPGTRLACMVSGYHDTLTACGGSSEFCGLRAQQVQDLLYSQRLSIGTAFIPGTLGRAEAGTATILDT